MEVGVTAFKPVMDFPSFQVEPAAVHGCFSLMVEITDSARRSLHIG